MGTFFGSLLHRLSTSNKEHLIWFGAVVVIMIILAILHHKWKGNDKKIRLWRLLCLIPLITGAVHAFIYLTGFPLFVIGHFPLYVIALSALLPIPFAKRKIGYRVTGAITGLVTCVFGFYYLGMSPLYFNHSRESYTESFHSLVQDMDKHYILKEWKEVDFAALEEKYMPLVREAEQAQDKGKFTEAVMAFCCELHDGHVPVVTDDEGMIRFASYTMSYKPHEYGLAMVQLDSGDVIAVCTTDDVNKLGIGDGTVITKWGGKDVLQSLAEDVPDLGMPVKENADRVAAMVLSGVGGDTAEVSFIDKDGSEQTVTLTDLGEPHTQLEAFRAYRHLETLGTEEEFQSLDEENFTTKMLDDKCGYLRITTEGTDDGLYDMIVGYMTGDHARAREMFRQKLRDLRAQGMKYLVIDLRNNQGGADEITNALCDLFATEDQYGLGVGTRKNGKYICNADHNIHADGEFAELKVVALTNFGCLSAGDSASFYLSRLPNVTLAGLTDPYGCNQETGGISVLSGGELYVGYPVGLVLDGNGDPNIDTRPDRISRNPVEERILLDYDAAMKIFRDKEDYELEWAIQYLESESS
ncbi:MAG: hypothetical protein J6M90_00370 [Oscillospiraceae bacterium]|nr:hypothetical protein [Oscillospiraceae bacterium]